MKNKILAISLFFIATSNAVSADMPKDARAAIAASPEAIKAYVLKQFAPAGYSIDSDNLSQLKISRALSEGEKTQWQFAHWSPGGLYIQCRRMHTFVMLAGSDKTDVIMHWETSCTQTGEAETRIPNTNKKEVEWMKGQLESAKSKLES
jgi:hypothetical protein